MGVLPQKGPTMNQRLPLGYIAAAALTLALLAILFLLPARSSGRDQPRTSIKIGGLLYRIEPARWRALLREASEALASRTQISLKDGCGNAGALAWARIRGSTGYMLYPSRKDFSTNLLHELGHIFGLGHDNDPEDVMYPSARPDRYLTQNYLKAMKSFLSKSESIAA